MDKIRIGDTVQVVSDKGIGEFEVGEQLIVIRFALDYIKVINREYKMDYLHRSKLIKI